MDKEEVSAKMSDIRKGMERVMEGLTKIKTVDTAVVLRDLLIQKGIITQKEYDAAEVAYLKKKYGS